MKTLKMFAVVAVMLVAFASTAKAQQLVEASLFGGAYWGETGDWSYYGAGGSVFPFRFPSDIGQIRLGPSAEVVGWSGSINQNIDFDGYKVVGGVEVQRLSDQSKDALKVRYGLKHGVTSINDGTDIVAESNLLNLSLTHQQWWDRKYFGRYLFEARADIDLTGGETSQTEYGLAGQLDFVRGSKGFLFGGLSWNHCESNIPDSTEVSLGVRLFKEVLEVRGSRLFRDGNNAWGVGLVLNLHHLFGQ